MTKPVESSIYKAPWHPSLDPSQSGPLQQVASKVKNVLFYVPISLVALCINPRKECFTDDSNLIQTPDKVTLGIRIDEPDRPNGQYVIMFNPLSENAPKKESLGFNSLDQTLKVNGFHVVRFNYRGLISTWNPKDLIIDGESVYQYLAQHHHVDPKNIHFYGHSLGGAVAAEVKALHPECTGKYIGDRTFRSMFHVVSEWFAIRSLGSIVQKISTLFARLIGGAVAYPLHWLDLNLDAERALNIMVGEKKVFHLFEDIVMHGVSGLEHANKLSSEETILMNEIPSSRMFSHFPPICQLKIASPTEDNPNRTIRAVDAAVQFLLI